MSALLALWLLIARPDSLTTGEKLAAGLAVCDVIAEDFGYHGCVTELNTEETHMWLHLLCFEWDPVRERGVYNQHAVIAYVWEHGMLKAVSAPYLTGCPRFI